MHGLADIRHMNDLVLTTELNRRNRLAAARLGGHPNPSPEEVSADEVKRATKYVALLRGHQHGCVIGATTANDIADLLVSAYGIQED